MNSFNSFSVNHFSINCFAFWSHAKTKLATYHFISNNRRLKIDWSTDHYNAAVMLNAVNGRLAYRDTFVSVVMLRIVWPFLPMTAPTNSLGTRILHNNHVCKTLVSRLKTPINTFSDRCNTTIYMTVCSKLMYWLSINICSGDTVISTHTGWYTNCHNKKYKYYYDVWLLQCFDGQTEYN